MDKINSFPIEMIKIQIIFGNFLPKNALKSKLPFGQILQHFCSLFFDLRVAQWHQNNGALKWYRFPDLTVPWSKLVWGEDISGFRVQAPRRENASHVTWTEI